MSYSHNRNKPSSDSNRSTENGSWHEFIPMLAEDIAAACEDAECDQLDLGDLLHGWEDLSLEDAFDKVANLPVDEDGLYELDTFYFEEHQLAVGVLMDVPARQVAPVLPDPELYDPNDLMDPEDPTLDALMNTVLVLIACVDSRGMWPARIVTRYEADFDALKALLEGAPTEIVLGDVSALQSLLEN